MVAFIFYTVGSVGTWTLALFIGIDSWVILLLWGFFLPSFGSLCQLINLGVWNENTILDIEASGR